MYDTFLFETKKSDVKKTSTISAKHNPELTNVMNLGCKHYLSDSTEVQN